MTEEVWSEMSEEQQTQHCWQELSRLLLAVEPPPYQAGNAETLGVPGLTTLVTRRREGQETV